MSESRRRYRKRRVRRSESTRRMREGNRGRKEVGKGKEGSEAEVVTG